MQFYYYPLFLILVGIGAYFLISERKRQTRLQEMLNPSNTDLEFFQSKKRNDDADVASIEKMLRKSSKVITVSALLDKNIMAKVLAVMVVTIILYGINTLGIFEVSQDVMLISILVVMIIVIILPNKIKQGMIERRIKRISNDIPFIIDMMAVCVQSGMTIESTLRYLADNTAHINPDIANLLDRAMLKSEVSGIGAALDLLYTEVPSTEVRMFCSTLQQSIKYGSSIYQVLLDLSKEIREMQLLAAEEKIASLPAKMAIPMIVFIMLPILAMVAGPGVIRMIQNFSSQ
jgi:tight adherence protein C